MTATTTRRISTPQSRRTAEAVRGWRREGAAGTLGVIDPGSALSDELAHDLAGSGLAVLRSADPYAALVRFATRPVQVAVLVVESDRPGTGPVVQALRDELALPVLLAWDPACSQPPADAVLAGAQPVLRLPLELDDLLARLGEAWPTRPPDGSVLSAGDLVVDTGAYEATLRGAALGLARREMDVLLALVQSSGRVVPRERLCRLWPSTSDQDGNLVATVARLRRHLAHVGAREAIATVRGIGYRLDVAAVESDVRHDPVAVSVRAPARRS
ncbi:MAG: response regulator transcription factor [Micrococcales bacterium]|nr:response regulator transcription factor [Micrococcales bacterium]